MKQSREKMGRPTHVAGVRCKFDMNNLVKKLAFWKLKTEHLYFLYSQPYKGF